MLIVADENIPFVREAFGRFGSVVTSPGRAISNAMVRDAGALIIRSVTRVDESLLAGANRLIFVGTTTIGTDHIDKDFLTRKGMAFSSAPGSNAESVAQYVAAVLCHFRCLLQAPLKGKSIGIVGVGQCGSRVERIARALGMEPVLCDPPLARTTGDERFRPLNELTKCDYVSLHVPLTKSGEDATAGLIDEIFLKSMKPGSALIQVCRGGVVDEDALLATLKSGQLAGVAMDVWVGEPNVRMDLLEAATIATPHVAGYSWEGKVNATGMIYSAFCRTMNTPPQWRPEEILSAGCREIEIHLGASIESEAVTAQLIEQSVPLKKDDADFRRSLAMPAAEAGQWFDAMRKNYPERREFSATRVILNPANSDLTTGLTDLGFRL